MCSIPTPIAMLLSIASYKKSQVSWGSQIMTIDRCACLEISCPAWIIERDLYIENSLYHRRKLRPQEWHQSLAMPLIMLRLSLLATKLPCFSGLPAAGGVFWEHKYERDCNHDTRTGFLVTSSDSATWEYISSRRASWPSLGNWIINSASCFNKYGNACRHRSTEQIKLAIVYESLKW